MSKFNTVKFETTRELDKDRAVYVVFEKGDEKKLSIPINNLTVVQQRG